MNTYVGGLNGRKVTVEADSLYAAKQLVVHQLKPKKAELGLVWVELAEVEGVPVIHTPVN